MALVKPDSKLPPTVARWVLPGFAVSRLAAWGTVVVLAAATAYTTPFAPWSLHVADLSVGQGNPTRAAAAYDAVANLNPDPAIRARALHRSASVWSVELQRPAEALRRLRKLTRLPLEPAERAALYDRMGRMHLEASRGRDAVIAFRTAWKVAPEDPEAGARMHRMARAQLGAGMGKLALRTLSRMADEFPEMKAIAEFDRATYLLSVDEAAKALTLFESAAEHSFDKSLTRVARQGASTCLERLGDLDEALAELDEAELPVEVWDARSQRLRQRK